MCIKACLQFVTLEYHWDKQCKNSFVCTVSFKRLYVNDFGLGVKREGDSSKCDEMGYAFRAANASRVHHAAIDCTALCTFPAHVHKHTYAHAILLHAQRPPSNNPGFRPPPNYQSKHSHTARLTPIGLLPTCTLIDGMLINSCPYPPTHIWDNIHGSTYERNRMSWETKQEQELLNRGLANAINFNERWGHKWPFAFSVDWTDNQTSNGYIVLRSFWKTMFARQNTNPIVRLARRLR